MKAFITLVFLTLCAYSQAKSLTIGTTEFNPPYVMRTSSHSELTGFDIELMNRICALINVECRYKNLLFINTFSALQAGDIDMAIGGITISEDRKQVFNFSLPYMISYGRFLTYTGSRLKTIESLSYHTIGVQKNSVFEDYLKKELPLIKIKTYDKLGVLFEGLYDKEIDAVLVDAETGDYVYGNHSDALIYIGEEFPMGLGYGIMISPFKKNLLPSVNAAILKMQEDGSYIKLYNTYFGP